MAKLDPRRPHDEVEEEALAIGTEQSLRCLQRRPGVGRESIRAGEGLPDDGGMVTLVLIESPIPFGVANKYLLLFCVSTPELCPTRTSFDVQLKSRRDCLFQSQPVVAPKYGG